MKVSNKLLVMNQDLEGLKMKKLLPVFLIGFMLPIISYAGVSKYYTIWIRNNSALPMIFKFDNSGDPAGGDSAWIHVHGHGHCTLGTVNDEGELIINPHLFISGGFVKPWNHYNIGNCKITAYFKDTDGSLKKLATADLFGEVVTEPVIYVDKRYDKYDYPDLHYKNQDSDDQTFMSYSAYLEGWQHKVVYGYFNGTAYAYNGRITNPNDIKLQWNSDYTYPICLNFNAQFTPVNHKTQETIKINNAAVI